MSVGRNTILACTRIRCGKVGGSGTVLYSKPNKEEGISTYVLTNHHVVSDAIKVDKVWSPLLKRDIKMDILGTVEVHFFQYRWEQRAVGANILEADIMTYDPDEDLALLKLRSDVTVEGIAHLYPKGKERLLRIGEDTLAIGAGLGEPPVLTVGCLSQFGREIDNREFWLQTAPTIFGNSGGAVFLASNEEFIGVPARIPVIFYGFGADAITHLSYIIPITRVYKFIDDQMFRFIYDTNFTEEGEAAARRVKREEEQKKMLVSQEEPEKR